MQRQPWLWIFGSELGTFGAAGELGLSEILLTEDQLKRPMFTLQKNQESWDGIMTSIASKLHVCTKDVAAMTHARTHRHQIVMKC